MKAIVCVLLATSLAGCTLEAATSTRYKQIATARGKLCIDSRLPAKQMKMEGILGSDLGSSVRGVFVDYPAGGKAELTIFVRTSEGDERPLPEVQQNKLRPMQDIDGLSEAPNENHRGDRFVATEDDSTAIGRFVAVCRDLPIPRQCSRPFRYTGLVGTYSFKRDQLANWRSLESTLSDVLLSKQIVNCDNASSE